ncbi:hypothetical protein ACYOEI_24395 [Singulisphaera rosea]
MMEMRWVLEEGDADNWPQKVLQFRGFRTVVSKDGGAKFGSEWKDVPTVIEGE